VNRFWCIAACISCLSGTLATAHGAEVTLEACLERARGQNSGLKAVEKSKEAAVSDLAINRAAFLPSLSMQARYARTDQPERFLVLKDSLAPGLPGQDTNLADNRRDSYQAGLYLTQPLFTGGNLLFSYRRAEYQLRAAGHELDYQRAQLFEQVRRTFYEALAADIQVTARSKALKTREKLVAIARARQDEGFAGTEETLLAEADLTDAEAQLVTARQQSGLLLTRLRQLIHAAPDEALVPVGQLMKLHIDLPLESFLQSGTVARDDIQALQFKVQQKNAEVGMAKSGFFPTVSLQGGYLRQRDTYLTRPDSWSLALQAEWNLFDWGKTSATVQKMRAGSQQEQYRLEEQKKHARSEIELFWRQALMEQSRLLSLEARLKAAEHALQTSLARHQEGRIRQADLYLSEAALWQAYAEYTQSAALLHGIMASLERATTRPMDSWALPAPLHHPDFEAISAQLGAVAPVVHQPATVHPVSLPQPASTAVEAVALTGQAPKRVQPDTMATPAGTRHYVLQFGAFTQKSNAEKLLRELKARYPVDLRLTVVEKDALYKVVTGAYPDKKSLARLIQEQGITGYFLASD